MIHQEPTTRLPPSASMLPPPSRPSFQPFRSLMRAIYFTLFTVREYVASGRVLIEMIATAVFFGIFLRGDTTMSADKFFTMTSIFTLVLTTYTMSAVLGLGDRPQGYVVLARWLTRANYLLGLYLTTLVIVLLMYGAMSLATLIMAMTPNLTAMEWLLGSVPLLLNVGMLAAFLLLLSPMVFGGCWRLGILAMIALALSGNFLTGPMLEQIPSQARMILSSVQTILSWPLVPAFSGFALTQERTYDTSSAVILLAQGSMLIALLSIALYAFSRREMIFTAE